MYENFVFFIREGPLSIKVRLFKPPKELILIDRFHIVFVGKALV